MTEISATIAGPTLLRFGSRRKLWLGGLLLLLLAGPGWAQTGREQPRRSSPTTPQRVSLIRRADALRATAERSYEKGRYGLAARQYGAAYQLVRDLDPVRAASLCLDLSSMDYMDQKTERAIARCHTGLGHLHALPPRPDSAWFKLYSGLGTYHNELARYDSAAYWFGRADELLLANPRLERQIPLYVLFQYNNQANWLRKEGDYSRALLYLRKARVLARTHGKPEDQSYIESNMADCYDKLDKPGDALINYKSAYQHWRGSGELAARNLSDIGWACYRLRLYQEALAYYNRAERLLDRLARSGQDMEYRQVKLTILRSACYRAMGRWAEADQRVQQGLRICASLPNSRALQARLLTERAQRLEQQDQWSAALAIYEAGIGQLRQAPARADGSTANDPLLLLILERQAALYRQLYRRNHRPFLLDAALARYERAIAVQQRIRQHIDTDESRLFLTARHYALLPDAIATACDAYQQQPTARRLETVFQLLELSRAGSLRHALRLQLPPAQLPAALLTRARQLARHLSEQPLGRQAEPSAEELAWHQVQAVFRRQQLTSIPAEPPLSLAGLQHRLDPQTAYLSYHWQGNALLVLVVTAQTAHLLHQPVDSVALRRQLTALRQAVQTDPFMGQYRGRASAVYLYQRLVEPLLLRLREKNRLVIARDGQFQDLPFEVLETGQQANAYLCRQFSVSYAWAAQLFFRPVAGQPALPRSQLPVLVVAPFVRSTGGHLLAARRQSSSNWRNLSEAEARQIGGEVWRGEQATKVRLWRSPLNRSVIYWSTHAEANDRDPARSYLALGPGLTDRLTAREIATLPLTQTRLVVLSACAAGDGQGVQGEGVLSLARAFGLAGCRSVVTTGWTANNETTAYLTVRLHEHLTEGLPIDLALQQTRLDFFDSELSAKFDHPFYWANLSLLGNFEPVFPAPPTCWPWLLVALLTGVGLLLAYWQQTKNS